MDTAVIYVDFVVWQDAKPLRAVNLSYSLRFEHEYPHQCGGMRCRGMFSCVKSLAVPPARWLLIGYCGEQLALLRH